MINITRLDQELRDAGLVIYGEAEFPPGTQPIADPGSTWHNRPDATIRVDWPAPPSTADTTTAENTIQAHVGSITPIDRIDNAPLPNRIVAAVCMRVSSGWGTILTAQERTSVQEVIDKNAAKILAAFRGG